MASLPTSTDISPEAEPKPRGWAYLGHETAPQTPTHNISTPGNAKTQDWLDTYALSDNSQTATPTVRVISEAAPNVLNDGNESERPKKRARPLWTPPLAGPAESAASPGPAAAAPLPSLLAMEASKSASRTIPTKAAQTGGTQLALRQALQLPPTSGPIPDSLPAATTPFPTKPHAANSATFRAAQLVQAHTRPIALAIASARNPKGRREANVTPEPPSATPTAVSLGQHPDAAGPGTNKSFVSFIWQAAQVFQTLLDAGYTGSFQMFLQACGAGDPVPPIVKFLVLPIDDMARSRGYARPLLPSGAPAGEGTTLREKGGAPLPLAQTQKTTRVKDKGKNKAQSEIVPPPTRATAATRPLASSPLEADQLSSMDVDPPGSLNWMPDESARLLGPSAHLTGPAVPGPSRSAIFPASAETASTKITTRRVTQTRAMPAEVRFIYSPSITCQT